MGVTAAGGMPTLLLRLADRGLDRGRVARLDLAAPETSLPAVGRKMLGSERKKHRCLWLARHHRH